MTTTNKNEVFTAFLAAQASVDEATRVLADKQAQLSAAAGLVHDTVGKGPYRLPDGRRFSVAKRDTLRGKAGENGVKLEAPRYEVRFRGEGEEITIG